MKSSRVKTSRHMEGKYYGRKDEVSQTDDHSESKGKGKKGNWFTRFVVKFIFAKTANTVIAMIVLALLFGSVGFGLKSVFYTYGKTNTLGFKNIGELATQAAYSSNTRVDNDDIDFFGISIPFTKTRHIYSYDTIIKAGIDFGDVDLSVNELTKEIKIELPEVKVLSKEIDEESLEVYLEEDSIFTKVSLKDQSEAKTEMLNLAQQDAIDNGLLDNAKDNAETMLTQFVGNVYNLDEYTVTFVSK